MKYSRNTLFFKKTRAFELAKATDKGNLGKIEKLAKKDHSLLEVTNPVSGSNVLVLAIYMEQFKAFKKLLELGANPNFINPQTKHSVLMEAIKPFGTQFEWRIEPQYVRLLLKYGANPNYAIEEDFVNEKGHHIMATSPLMQASSLNLKIVKLLIKNGAKVNKRIGRETPLTAALSFRKFTIIEYMIDSLQVNVHQPMRIRKTDSLYIQDYIKKYMSYKKGTKGYQKTQKLIEKLKNMGVDFDDYDYKF